MCGRVRLSNDYSEIKIKLKFGSTAAAPNLEPSWNIPPTGRMLVATYAQGGERISEIMRWGLIPSWAKDIKIGYSTFNARADTVSTKPAFRDAWRKGRRCLVVTDGFYEWRKSDKQPFAIGMADDDVMVMAGLWEEWTSPDNERIKTGGGDHMGDRCRDLVVTYTRARADHVPSRVPAARRAVRGRSRISTGQLLKAIIA
jgi:putative SOS response-associated peptidase YedK